MRKVKVHYRVCMSGSAGIFDFIPRLYIDWHVGCFAVGFGWGRWFVELIRGK